MGHRLPPQQHYFTFDEFTLESGEILISPTIAFMFMGMLNAARENAILVCHALSGNADVGDWWSTLLNTPLPALDPSKYCIICCNSLGSPYGSSSPLTYRPMDENEGTARKTKTRRLYGADFPKTTLRDDVRIHRRVLDALGVRALHCVIGGSMGSMAALEWSLQYSKDYVQSIVLIATTAQQSAWGAAWAENQRCTIKCDPKFCDGHYSLDDPPLSGLAAARMAALLTYRTHKSFRDRFGRKLSSASTSLSISTNRDEDEKHGSTSLSRSYLHYQGEKFNARFDANCYMHILDKIDSHDITRGRCSSSSSLSSIDDNNVTNDEALRHVLSQIIQPTLVIGISTDGLYPPCEQQFLYENIPNAAFAQLESQDGHDGFLLEPGQLNALLHLFLG